MLRGSSAGLRRLSRRRAIGSLSALAVAGLAAGAPRTARLATRDIAQEAL
jgi:hypothetical protein